MLANLRELARPAPHLGLHGHPLDDHHLRIHGVHSAHLLTHMAHRHMVCGLPLTPMVRHHPLANRPLTKGWAKVVRRQGSILTGHLLTHRIQVDPRPVSSAHLSMPGTLHGRLSICRLWACRLLRRLHLADRHLTRQQVLGHLSMRHLVSGLVVRVACDRHLTRQ